MAKNKLRNIEAVQQMLAGKHRTQTRKQFYFGDAETAAEKSKVRAVGEQWTEDRGDGRKIYWEQREGYRVQSNHSWEQQKMNQEWRDYLRTFRNCPKETCTCMAPTRVDEKFRAMMGMCLDCVTEYETKLQIEGKFKEYAREKQFENVKAYIRDVESELERWKADIQTKSTFVNGDETLETWSTDNPQIMIDRMQAEFDEMKRMLMENYDPEKKI